MHAKMQSDQMGYCSHCFKKGQITALLYFCFILVFIIKVMNASGKFKVFFK